MFLSELSEMIMTAYFDQIYQTLSWFSRIRILLYLHNTDWHAAFWHTTFWIGFEKRAPDIYDKMWKITIILMLDIYVIM
jgi:hypothetical protein